MIIKKSQLKQLIKEVLEESVDVKHLKLGDKVEILRGSFKNKIGVVDAINSPDEDFDDWQIDVKIGKTTRYLGPNDLKLVK